ncbi:MAG: A24 family peptidase [Pseudomonadota bacterium]
MSWIIFATLGLIGLFVGSFLNVVIYRGPIIWGLIDASPKDADGENDKKVPMLGQTRFNFSTPRSFCIECGKPIARRDLIPLFSYLMLKGACPYCRSRISLRYPIVEVLGALVILLSFNVFGLSAEAFLATIFGWTLLVLAFIDKETGYLPDALTLPLIVGGIAMNTVDLFAPLPDAIIGGIAGYFIFWLIRLVFKAIRGEEGLGLGDAKLLAGICAWIGWQALPAIVFIGSVSSLLAIGLYRANRNSKIKANTSLAFGPGLAFAGFCAMVSPFPLY